jgi:hypothetical protein
LEEFGRQSAPLHANAQTYKFVETVKDRFKDCNCLVGQRLMERSEWGWQVQDTDFEQFSKARVGVHSRTSKVRVRPAKIRSHRKDDFLGCMSAGLSVEQAYSPGFLGGCFMLICARRHSGSTLQVLIAKSLVLLVLLLTAASGKAFGAPMAFVQTNSATPASAQTVTVPYTQAQTAGNLNVVVVGWNDSTSTISTVTDSLGNTYAVAAARIAQTGTASQAIYYAKNIASAAAGTNTVTVTFNVTANAVDIRIAEYSGLDTVNPLDVSVGAQGNSATSNSGSVTTTSANDLLVGANLVQSVTTAAGAGYTSRIITVDCDILEDRVVSATGSYSATAALDKVQPWIMQMVAFRAAGTTAVPAISSLNPISGPVGTSAAITGTNFGATQGSSTVNFNGTAATPTAWSATSITVPVPTGATTGNVVVTVGGQASNGVNFTVGTVSSILFVQTNAVSPQATQTPVTVTYTGAQTAGNLNVVIVSWNDSTATISSVTDTIGNTYAVAAATVVQTGTASQAIYYAKNIAAAAAGANTVTINFNVAARHPDIRIAEYSGVDPLNALDTSAGAQGNTATSDSGPVTTLNANDILIGANVVQSTTTGPGTGFTSRGITPDGDILEDQVVSATGSYNATAALDKVQLWIMQMAAFRAAVSGGGTVPNIATLSPASGPWGTSVTIAGSNFGATQGSSTVTFGHNASAAVTSWSATSIVVIVPAATGAGGGAFTGPVVVAVGGVVSNGITFTVTPNISSLSPASGPTGSSVTILGGGFGAPQGTSTVTFNGIVAIPTQWAQSGIVVPVPSGATTGNVVVTVGGVASNASLFTVTPSITSLSPTSGPVGSSLTITGVNFGGTQGTSTVTFSGTAATATSWSATSITVAVPNSLAINTFGVVVTVGGFASNTVNFAVTPSITSLSPTTGVIGTPVTITGTNFGSSQGSSSVTFNGIVATPSSWSNTSIVAPVPNGATSGNVVVTVGTGFATNGVPFTVTAPGPSITSLSPTSGPVGGSVTISGANFGTTQGTSTVTFNGTVATPTSWGATSIVVPVPVGATTGNVIVTVGGLVSNVVAFSVLPTPSITNLTPTSGQIGTSVSITGTNFGATQGTSTVALNGFSGATTSWAAASITTTVPTTNSGSFVVTVGGVASNGVSFTVLPPSITSLSPSSGPAGTSVTITGSGFGTFQGSNTISFNGVVASATTWSPTSIIVPVPAGATTGNVTVAVIGMVSNGASFSVTAPPPSITSLGPTSGAVGASVTIAGTNFGATQGTSTVTFNGTSGSPTAWTATSITVPVPAGATTGNVVVTVGGQASNGSNFTVVVPPSIAGLSPTSGPIGTPVTITGANFGATQGTSTVSFNGIAATPTSWNATTIVVPAPVGATTGNVVVTVGGQASNGSNFTVTTPTGISLVQHTGKDAGVTASSTLAFTSSNTAGNWIAVCIRAGHASQVLTVTDSRGNTYHQAVLFNMTVDTPNGETLGVFYAENIAGGANSVTVKESISNNTLRFAILEYSGVALANSLDATATSQGVSNAASSGTPGNVLGGDLLLGLITTSNPAVFTPGAGYTIRDAVPGSSNAKLITEDQIQAAAGTASTTASLSVSDQWGAALAAFKAGSGGPSGPSISSLNPTSGLVGTSVTITGANFGATQGTSTVTFNGTLATPTSWNATSIVVPVPTGATSGNVVVTVGGTASNGVTFTVTLPPPSISNLNPTSGLVGTSVTITGTNFGATQGTSAVKFNGTTATTTAWSATSITALVPAGATTGNVVVTVGGVASNGMSFTVLIPPSITTLTPNSGTAGTSVTIAGANFGTSQGSSTVTFNGIAATPTSWTTTSIAVPVPTAATTGNVVVTVGGLASNGLNFTVVVPPSITSLTPNSGTVGTAVVIAGANFGASQGTSTVTFNGITSTPTSWSAGSVAAPVPNGATTGNVVVTVSGVASNGSLFTITSPGPSLTSLGLTQGPVGALITIVGTNFVATQGTSTVTFNGTVGTPSNWTATSIDVPVPVGATTGNVVVTVAGIASNGLSFTVTPPPNITSISPVSGPIGAVVTINGTNFGPTVGTRVSGVTFNGVSARTTSWSDTQIILPVPVGATTGNVVVSISGVVSNSVLFTVAAPPAITTVNPTGGPVGTSVTISGSSFGLSQGTSTITFNGTTATPTGWSDTSIVTPVPAGATTGNVVVSVGGVASNGVAFTVTAGSGSIKLVQHIGKDAGTSNSSALAFPANNTAGNWIAVVIRAGKSGQILSVSDSHSNVYKQAVLFNMTLDGETNAIYYAENIAGGANTVTVSDNLTGGSLRFSITEYSGVALSNSLDIATATEGTGTAAASPTVSTSWGGDLLLSEITTANIATFTAGSGYKIEDFVPAEPNTKLIGEDQIQTVAGNAATSGSLSASDSWSALFTAFKSANGIPPLPITVNISPASASVSATFGTQGFTATLTNDVQNRGVTWALSGAGCSGSTCGTLTNVTSTSVTYNGPSAIPSPATVTLTATAIADNTKFNTSTITVVQGPLAVFVTPKRGSVTTSQTQQFTATVFNDPGNAGVTWQVDGSTGGNSTTGTISTTGLFTPGTQPGMHTITAVSVTNASVTASVTFAVSDIAGVYMHHNDPARTGQNLKEYALTTANVNSTTFAQLFSCPVDGQLYAQPLYMANLLVGSTTHNVVFLATEHDSVYAFDADSPSCVQLWKTSFLSTNVTPMAWTDTANPNIGGGGATNDIFPEIGITGTPVIDPATNTIYVEAKTKETVGSGCSSGNPCYVHRLHALNVVTGAEKFGGPVVISAPKFDPQRHFNRPALLLANGTVYVAMGSHGDIPNWQGWVWGYNASTLAQSFVFSTSDPTSGSNGASVWDGGAGPAADASGNVYVTTGNGTYDGTKNFSETVLKLSPTGTLLDWFTPFNFSVLDANDIDMGSTGVMILPDAVGSTTHQHLLIGTGKIAVLYLLDQTNMGRLHSGSNLDLQEVIPVPPPNTTQLDGGNYGVPAYWNGNIYTTGQNFPLSQFTIANGVIATPQSSVSANTFPPRGAIPAVSASGTTNGIVWVLDLSAWASNGPAVLDAYDATNVGTMLFSSPSGGTGAAGAAVKFTVPTVANGKVYVGGQASFCVYGLLPN